MQQGVYYLDSQSPGPERGIIFWGGLPKSAPEVPCIKVSASCLLDDGCTCYCTGYKCVFSFCFCGAIFRSDEHLGRIQAFFFLFASCFAVCLAVILAHGASRAALKASFENPKNFAFYTTYAVPIKLGFHGTASWKKECSKLGFVVLGVQSGHAFCSIPRQICN